MDILSNLALGFGTSLQPANLLYCFVGVLLGTGVARALVPLVQDKSFSYLGPFDVPWTHVLGIAAFGMLTRGGGTGRRLAFDRPAATLVMLIWFAAPLVHEELLELERDCTTLPGVSAVDEPCLFALSSERDVFPYVEAPAVKVECRHCLHQRVHEVSPLVPRH